MRLLEFLRDTNTASDRKARLFAVACARRYLHLTPDSSVGQAVDVAEQFADGLVGDAERSNALNAAEPPPTVREWPRIESLAYYVLARHAMEAAWKVPGLVVQVLMGRAGGFGARDGQANREDADTIHSGIIRDIFVWPFRPTPAVDPSWLAWNGGTVAKLAAAIYDARRFADLPILADALEDAGCADAAILGHCRGGGEHVRGCWVVDLLAGRQ
jgi:hypothetical protein